MGLGRAPKMPTEKGRRGGAAAVVRALAEGEVEQPGICLAEQVVPSEPFFERLAAQGLVPRVEAPLSLFQA